MKKYLLIISAIALVTIAGYFTWQHYHSCGSACGYNSKMSMVCELSCAAKDVDETKIVAQTKAKSGDFTKCPISGVIFQVNTESAKITYKGKSAYTCCETCAQIFNESPIEYAANIN